MRRFAGLILDHKRAPWWGTGDESDALS
jgi:hypothetical protein